jgi:hypothetical protein
MRPLSFLFAFFILLSPACSGGSGLTELPTITSSASYQLTRAVLTSDGKLAAVQASGSGDAATELRIYELATGKLLWRDSFDSSEGQTLFDARQFFSPDGQQVAVEFSDDERGGTFARIYNAQTGDLISDVALQRREKLYVAGTGYVITAEDNMLYRRNTATGDLESELALDGQIDWARFVNAGELLLIGYSRFGGAHFLGRVTPATLSLSGEAVASYGALGHTVWVSQDGTRVAGTVVNGQATWAADATTGTQLYALPAAAVANEAVRDPRFAYGSGILADGRYIYATNAGYITANNLTDQSWVTLLELQGAFPNALAVSADGKMFLVANDESLQSWRLP